MWIVSGWIRLCEFCRHNPLACKPYVHESRHESIDSVRLLENVYQLVRDARWWLI